MFFAQIKHTCMHTKVRLSTSVHLKNIIMASYEAILSWMQLYVVDAARVILLKSRNFKFLTKKVLISQRRLVVG